MLTSEERAAAASAAQRWQPGHAHDWILYEAHQHTPRFGTEQAFTMLRADPGLREYG